MNISNHLPGFNVEAIVQDFSFDPREGTITVIWKMPHDGTIGQILDSPDGSGDSIWREVYGVVNGELELMKFEQGSYIPEVIIPGHYKFEENGN